MVDDATKCDDNNTESGDGCDEDCKIEAFWECTGGTPTSQDECTEICGDGIVVIPKEGYCDDGNDVDDDGCTK
jgi:cysteine-rich repeat protein